METEKSKFTNDTFARSGQTVMSEYRSAEEAWAHFCCCPDSVAPQKMPSLFPTPTHLVRRRITKTIDANEYKKLIYAPEYLYGQGVLVGKSNWGDPAWVQIMGQNSGVPALQQHEYGYQNHGDWGPQPSIPSSGNKAYYVYDPTPPLSHSVAEGGVRLIGACISIEYLGKIDNIEGLVEIGMSVNTQNVSVATCPLSDVAFLSDTAVNQAPYYTRHRLSDGVRTIWFPMDESRFEFNEAHRIVDRAEFEAYYPGLWDAKNARTYVISATNRDAQGQMGINLPGATHYLDHIGADSYRLENQDHHSRARLEWAINFIGLTGPCPVRIYINQYYETIPHEENQDDYFPQKSPQGNSDVSTKLMHTMSQAVAVTTKTGTSGWEFAKNVLGKIVDYAKPFVAPIAASIAAARGMPMLSAGIMYGAGYASQGNLNADQSSGMQMLPYRASKYGN